MRRFLMLTLVIALLCTTTVFAAAETVKTDDFEYTADGTIVAYYGGPDVFVPGTIGDTPIVKIGEKAFFDLGIDVAYIDEGITSVENSAFEGSNIESLSLPETMAEVGDNAFANCSLLKEVFVFSPSALEFGENVFAGTGELIFYIHCDENESVFAEKFEKAKGDKNFTIKTIHRNLVDNPDEKDAFNALKIYCTACNYNGSRYLDDFTVPFKDVAEDAWYLPYVAFAHEYGIINGKSDTIFDPDAGMTCAEAAKIAATIHAFQTTSLEDAKFEQGEKWYDGYVKYCYDNQIIERGLEFDWDKPIKRGEMAYLFARSDVYSYYVNEVPLTDIPDVTSATPYVNYILDLYNKGVAVGDETMAFRPDSEVLRSEAAAFIARILAWEMRIELPKG